MTADAATRPAGDTTSVVRSWYDRSARDLPWRRAGTTPWEVLVSEFMLQQTPVARVLPTWQTWVNRWPSPAALGAAAPGEAVRAWGRLGYPRRALRLHATAVAIVRRHGGAVPADVELLRALPGVGAYTAGAVAAFAYERRTLVLDTNVRRLLARLVTGRARPATTSPTRAERELAGRLLPAGGAEAAHWSQAAMELGATLCSVRTPACDQCPVRDRCRWLAVGSPADTRPTGARPYAGSDRQCRGRLLAVLRAADGPVTAAALDPAWDEPQQRIRALSGLMADGLVEQVRPDRFALPGTG